jgi:hypothetical protein
MGVHSFGTIGGAELADEASFVVVLGVESVCGAEDGLHLNNSSSTLSAHLLIFKSLSACKQAAAIMFLAWRCTVSPPGPFSIV